MCMDVDSLIHEAFKDVVNRFNEINKVIITEPRQWPPGFGVTQRRSGEVVSGSFRNIVDLGNLLNSQKLTFNNRSARLEWDGNNVTPVVKQYTGWQTESGKYIPGRPWVEIAIQEHKELYND